MTTRRDELLIFVASFTKKNGYPPSLTEIADALGIGLSTTWYHVMKLKKEKRITHIPNQSRTIRVRDES